MSLLIVVKFLLKLCESVLCRIIAEENATDRVHSSIVPCYDCRNVLDMNVIKSRVTITRKVGCLCTSMVTKLMET